MSSQCLCERHERELALGHAAFCELVQLVDRQQARIERLEQIIVAMANGAVSSPPDAGIIHTHNVYPLNGAKTLVDEIKGAIMNKI